MSVIVLLPEEIGLWGSVHGHAGARSRLEPAQRVAGPHYSLDAGLAVHRQAQLFPNATDSYFQVGWAAPFVAPGELDQAVVGHHPALVGGQDVENPELQRR